MEILLAVFLTLTSYFDAGQSNEVCLSLSQAGAASASQLELAQGPPGRRGPQGPVGHKGDTGDPGQCGCNPSEIEQLRRQIDLLRAESCIGGFIYDGSCLKLLYTRGSGGNYDQAVRDCSINNGSLVEITSDRKYDLVVKYVNRTWDVYDSGHAFSVNIWLGISYTV
ncbi:unnamed protein product [Clavelina lepadiformis]|uniref:C-type lectin domain-containing protein n=1 Tax=Clavelina lepadiformis TaxID=159417 RepID=A0ABP0FLE5_CLALP